MRIAHLVSLAPLCGFMPQVVAWGAAGHEITATIAQMYLFDSTREALCSVLPGYANCHLGPIAAWADKIKWANRWSSNLHFVNPVGDHPGNHCSFGERGWEGAPGVNVLGGIRNTSAWMRDGKSGTEEALKFFVHFMGDMHMPLHLTGRNKGGNGDRVRWDGRQAKFHAVWDGLIIAKAIRITPYNYTYPLPNPLVESSLRGAIYDPFIRQIVWEGLLGDWADEIESWTLCPSVAPVNPNSAQHPLGALPTDDNIVCPYAWAKPLHALNCEIVWPPSMDRDNHPAIELDTPEYAGRIEKERLVGRLLAMAGIRTAAVLNSIFGDPEESRGKLLDLTYNGH
ncbi:phospholipase C/P1 nuclease [Ramaria rubella]|nr:phospholipase C/P1 nuclease [Ramaria rubella]